MYNLLLAVLFFVLSPGVLLTLPAGSKGVWMSGQTSVAAALVHSFVFVIVLTIVKKYLWNTDGFNTSKANGEKCSKNSVCQSLKCTGANVSRGTLGTCTA